MFASPRRNIATALLVSAIASWIMSSDAASGQAALARPSARLTPGAIGTRGVAPTVANVCSRGYARAARHPYDAQWRRYRAALLREYAIAPARRRLYTIDHLIPIELGGRAFGGSTGAWDLRNVWPQAKAQALRKDAVENALHAAVCYRRGYHGVHLTLAQAQQAIAADWTRTPVGLPSERP
ncbi:MAG: hypothetical protein M3R44_06780 [Candidatus Eremiobacteraeota bacterium]|nr:hypothetical protein [Candidatus Eremiobacteraeota bacterium]